MSCRTLVVEDSATQAEAVRSLLEAEGHEVILARSAEAALALLEQRAVDVVLSDVVMPGLSGYELCRILKQDARWRDVPVVLLTSLTDPMDIVRGLECGADNYITKPFDPEHLLARLRHVLDNRRLRRSVKTSMGVTVHFLGRDLTITSEKEQILDLFISSVEDVVRANEALQRSQRELADAHAQLEAFARAKAHEARISTERYRALLQNAGDAIFVLDVQGRIVEANRRAAGLLEHDPAELWGRPLEEWLAEDAREAFRARFERLGDAGQVHLGEHRVVQGESERWCELIASLTPLDDQDLVLLIARDITERRRAERALLEREAAEHASQAKSEFLSRMSHELRTPLNAILGFAQLLEMDAVDDDQSESAQQILRAGGHLLDLINEVLDLSRIEAGKLSLSLEPVSVRDVLRDAVGLIRPLASQRGITVHTDGCDETELYVRADLQRLKQVVLNFLSNAIKYNREGGAIFLCLCVTEDERVRIGVRDTGPGIPEEKRERLFVPFDRLDAHESEIEGTGLGLVLSRGIAEAMGGRIGLESEVGEGSTFWIELPRDGRPEPTPIPAGAPEGTPSRRSEGEEGTHTVLYIEDNLSNLRLVERLLASRPELRLLPAMQGSLGLELARQHRPELILLDLNLPDISGEEVLGQLRQDPALRETAVVVISADAMPTQVDRLMRAGASDYLTKPLDVKRFLGVVDASL
jgi:PAS domain S-box-containing protein